MSEAAGDTPRLQGLPETCLPLQSQHGEGWAPGTRGGQQRTRKRDRTLSRGTANLQERGEGPSSVGGTGSLPQPPPSSLRETGCRAEGGAKASNSASSPQEGGKQSWHVHRKSFRASRISNGLMGKPTDTRAKQRETRRLREIGHCQRHRINPHQRTKAHQTPVSYLTDEAKELSSRSRELILDRVPEHTTGAGQPFHK